MKIACVEDKNVILKEAQKPTLEEFGGVGAIVKIKGCGLCGSDIVKLRDKLVKNGTVLGHEIVGQIEEINSKTQFKVGDNIVSSHHIPCFECVFCKNENYSMCKHFKSTNIRPGGFSEYIYLSEEHLENVAVNIPENLTDIEASFYEPLGCCIRAVKRAVLPKGSTVAVIGLGSIGLLMGQALKAFGMKVIGCDLLAERINLALELGFDECVNSHDMEETRELIFSKTDGYGADAIFMTSGADATIPLAIKLVRSGGKIVIFASTPRNTGYANNEIYYRELTVMGSYSPSPADLKDSIKLLAEKKVKVNKISTEYKFEDIEKSIYDTIENKVLKAYIKIS
ncbi:alcohol dehydrogenase catalytic domain-containing protein [bacterium]|nr:alcohol dehydrogenase catalytic domain-containing protein [bacterium]